LFLSLLISFFVAFAFALFLLFVAHTHTRTHAHTDAFVGVCVFGYYRVLVMYRVYREDFQRIFRVSGWFSGEFGVVVGSGISKDFET